MEDKSFLFLLSSRLDNEVLKTLSKTPLWLSIREFASEQYFWYLRTQHLLGEELKQRPNEDWKEAYYILLQTLSGISSGRYGTLSGRSIYEEQAVTPDKSRLSFTDRVLSSKLATEILLELGINPSVDNNRAIKNASTLGYVDTVRVLLADPRVDPSVQHNYVLRHALASRNGQEIVKLLEADRRVQDTSLEVPEAEMMLGRDYDGDMLSGIGTRKYGWIYTGD